MSPAPAVTALPHLKSLRDMLVEMMGRDVTVAPAEPWAPTPRDPGAVAVYVDDRSRLQALIAVDLELSAAMGSAIALIPADAAAAAVEARSLTEGMQENLYEVLNILSALFNMPNRPHLKLYAMHAPGALPPADVSAQLRAFGKREDLTVQVDGYGQGRLSLVLA